MGVLSGSGTPVVSLVDTRAWLEATEGNRTSLSKIGRRSPPPDCGRPLPRSDLPVGWVAGGEAGTARNYAIPAAAECERNWSRWQAACRCGSSYDPDEAVRDLRAGHEKSRRHRHRRGEHHARRTLS